MKTKIRFLLSGLFAFFSLVVSATCPSASFKLTVSNSSSPQCFVITADYTSRIVCTANISGTQTVTGYVGAGSLNIDACGIYLASNVCYTIRPLDWTSGQEILSIKILAAGGWNNNLSINYNSLNQQFTVTMPGNISLYELNQCRVCTNDRTIAANSLFSDQLTESGTWIKTAENVSGTSVVINPNTNVILDAHTVNGYIKLQAGFLANPTTGSFRAQLADGCGPEIPGAKSLDLKMFVEGYIEYGPTMKPVLLNQGISTNSSFTDFFTIELKDQNTPFTTLSSSDAILRTDGTLHASFPPGVSGSEYIAVKGRNMIQSWSALPVSFTAPVVNYNFSTAASQTYGGNCKMIDDPFVVMNFWAFFSGDINQDENIDLIDAIIMEDDISNFSFGYKAPDLNGDGNVDLLDSPVMEGNINNFIFASHP